jgi:2-oxoglutarate ferredoxin oxidoreductase subunit alpha
MRLRALPMAESVRDFVEQHDAVYVVELNRDGQLHAILQTEMPALATKLHSAALLDGWPLTAARLIELLEEKGAFS